MLTEGAITPEAAGAEIIVLCTNTMHRLADSIERAITVPFLHIADATAAAIREHDIGTVALLGTRYTMEQPFYRNRLASHGVEVMVPRQHGRAAVHRVIYEELVKGIVRENSRHAFQADALISLAFATSELDPAAALAMNDESLENMRDLGDTHNRSRP